MKKMNIANSINIVLKNSLYVGVIGSSNKKEFFI